MAEPEPSVASRRRELVRDLLGGRGALAAFIALEVGAFPLLMYLGNRVWFTVDDWDFFSTRTAGNVGDLFRGHFQHLVIVPILAYRLLWQFVGMRSYAPYQAMVVLLHLVAVALLRIVMRRAGVRPWVATVMALVLVVFGAGAENIVVAFQISFVGAFVFGLAQLLLADHDGPIDRRDWLGLLAGFVGLGFSGVAIAMTIVVGLAILLRRGRSGVPVALFHTVPLALVYGVWSLLAPKGQSTDIYRTRSLLDVTKFVLIGLGAGFQGLGRVPGVGIAIGLLLVAGLVVAYRARGRIELRHDAGAVVALLVGAVLFLAVTGFVRAGKPATFGNAPGFGPSRGRESRYVYLIAAMALPAIALAVDSLISRSRRLTIPILALVLVGVPANIHELRTYQPHYVTLPAEKGAILSLPLSPLADELKNSNLLVPFPRLSPEGLTLGWIVRSRKSFPVPWWAAFGGVVQTQTLTLFLQPTNPGPGLECRPLTSQVVRPLRRGDSFTVERGTVQVIWAPAGKPPSAPVRFRPGTYRALVGPLRLLVAPTVDGTLTCQRATR